MQNVTNISTSIGFFEDDTMGTAENKLCAMPKSKCVQRLTAFNVPKLYREEPQVLGGILRTLATGMQFRTAVATLCCPNAGLFLSFTLRIPGGPDLSTGDQAGMGIIINTRGYWIGSQLAIIGRFYSLLKRRRLFVVPVYVPIVYSFLESKNEFYQDIQLF